MREAMRTSPSQEAARQAAASRKPHWSSRLQALSQAIRRAPLRTTTSASPSKSRSSERNAEAPGELDRALSALAGEATLPPPATSSSAAGDASAGFERRTGASGSNDGACAVLASSATSPPRPHSQPATLRAARNKTGATRRKVMVRQQDRPATRRGRRWTRPRSKTAASFRRCRKRRRGGPFRRSRFQA